MSDLYDQEDNQPRKDVTGRDRIVQNTVLSWAAQLIIIITGFVMPRLMHETLGQTMLGIWDFAWTFINYFNLMSLGIGSSVNRYVAKYRAERRLDALNVAISTVTTIQVIIALLVVALLFPLYHIIATYFGDRLGDELGSAQAVIVFLGLALAIEMLTNSSRGVITGQHRWDIHNGIHAASAFVSVVLMGFVLVAGGDIVDVSIAYLCTIFLTETFRLWVASRIANDVKLDPRMFSLSAAKELVIFGIKTLLVAFPQVILIQSVNVVTVAFLGPAALAIYARPFALIRHLFAVLYKFTMILTPTAGSIQAISKNDEVNEFLKEMLRLNFALALPAIIVMIGFGDLVVQLWMGEEYRNWPLIAILAAGNLLAMGQDGFIRILQGLNMHGRLAIYLTLGTLITGLATYYFLTGYEWTLLHSAILLSVPMTLCLGIFVPVYGCWVVKLPLLDYVFAVVVLPVLYNLPFIAGVAASRYLLETGLAWMSALLFLASLAAELAIYYKVLLPEATKEKLRKRFDRAAI